MQKVEGEKRKERGRRHRRTTKLINSNYKENRKPNTNRKLNIQSLISLKKIKPQNAFEVRIGWGRGNEDFLSWKVVF